MSAIDTALWDIAGKAAGKPLYQLLGGYRSEIEAYASQGLWLHNTPDELAEEARTFVEQGFRGVKMRLGKPNPLEDLERVRIVREAVGPDVVLMVDVNQVWDAKTAIRMGRELEEFNLFWIEEPVPAHDLSASAEVRAALATPICTGETNYTHLEFRRLLETKAADILMPDLMRMGGITGWVKVAHLCQAHNVPVTPHLFMEVSAHLAGACPNAIWQEYQPWWMDCFKEPIRFADGKLLLSDRPGLGLEWDWERINHHLLA
jgi:L-alanine-DL-glutamate epimerase-like enolase superfamily enzyme